MMSHETRDPRPCAERRPAYLSSRRRGVPPWAWASIAAIGMLACPIAGSRCDADIPAYVAAVGGVFSLDVSNPADGGTPLVTDSLLIGAGGLSIDSGGNLLVSSIFNDLIPRYDSHGNLINIFSDANALDHPSISLVGPNGNLFVLSAQFDPNPTDTILQLNASTGRVVNSINVKSVNAAYDATGAMTIGPDGRLYVGVLDNGAGSILRFNAQTGQYIDKFISQGTFPLPQTMTFGPFGFLYVASRNFEGVGEIQRFSAGTGRDLGVISNVDLNTMAFGPDGKLYGLTPDGTLDRLKVDANGATLEDSRAVSSLAETGVQQMKFVPNTLPGEQTALDLTMGGTVFSKDLILHFQDVEAVGVTSPVGVDPATLRGIAGVTLLGAFDLSSSALFAGPITLDLLFDPAMLPAGFTEADLRLFAYDPSTGLRDITSFVNLDGQFIEADADMLGTFAIGVVPEPSAMALLGLGAIGLSLASRRRRVPPVALATSADRLRT
jgi:DNA-binding beta-propeller fold protein YncE